jgi:hypothetical protein
MGPLEKHRYWAFGLLIESQVLLDELCPSDDQSPAEVEIKFADFGRPLPELGQGVLFDYDSSRGVEMIWPGVAAIRIVDNKVIEIEAYPETTENLLAFPILGPVFAWILEKRGNFVLHASAVAISGHCIGFLGDKLAGKSTTAAAFLRRGGQLVTDDLMALALDACGAPVIQPAFAQVKLADDAAEVIKIDGAEALPMVFEGFLKRQHRLETMHNSPIVLSRIFVLERGSIEPEIEFFDWGNSLKALLRFSYASRFADAPEDRIHLARQFRQCAGVISSARVGVLRVPASLIELDNVVDFVLSELAQGN